MFHDAALEEWKAPLNYCTVIHLYGIEDDLATILKYNLYRKLKKHNTD
jgi:hypothetical protein